MQITDYHAKYYAHELTRRYSADDAGKLAGTLVDAQVDLNPHQVDAALFAFRSPLSKGALLADEVGLGKTIEAGLVISQRWAERQRRILIITPSNLRKQWLQEMQEKFFLPCRILESKSYNQAIKSGQRNPFEGDDIVVCSYHFARNKSDDVGRIPWHLVVIDEAHRLRNVYKRSNKIANELRATLRGTPKLLLTATPLQNSLLELYGLVSFIDEHAFGDLKSFREQFADLSHPRTFSTLKARLRPLCQRTLRSQVLPYIRYTRRLPILQEFTPTEDELVLYDLVSEYLRKPQLFALPSGQRHLLTLVLRKLLASSTFAIAGALDRMARRLRQQLESAEFLPEDDLSEQLDADFEHLDEIVDEWDEVDTPRMTAAERTALEIEISELESFYELAISISQNAKGQALLQALETAFAKAQELGGAQKALVFTESRRTQNYLLQLLTDSSPYRDGIVLFNGSNNDAKSREIYQSWVERHRNTDRMTGSRTADMRSALVDYFREQGQIMIATEAGAEGINLQFCSLVVNYDLPWNPQRVEQRIGRCHRYGQQHDVVVVNFLNRQNAADKRVYELLDEKFKLFEGVFGASDEVLGAVESGVAFEKRIAEIYQSCRTSDEINTSFDELQQELSGQIAEAMTNTRQQLLEHFDDEVKEKLRLRDRETKALLNLYEEMLMRLTRHELAGQIQLLDASSFRLLQAPPGNGIPLGIYELPRRSGDAHFYRLAEPLAQFVLNKAKRRPTPVAELHFAYTDAPNKVSAIEQLIGQSGWLQLSQLTVESLQQTEDHLIWVGMSADGQPLEADTLRRIFTLPATVAGTLTTCPESLQTATQSERAAILFEIDRRNGQFFEDEIRKLDAWADDRKLSLEREIKDFDRRIKEARRNALSVVTLQEKLTAQKEVKRLERERKIKRRDLFVAQDEIDEKRDEIISETESRMAQSAQLTNLFSLRWHIV